MLGSDTYPDNLYVLDGAGGGARVRLALAPPTPFQPGDRISVIGLWRRVDGEPAIDAATAHLTDIVPASELPVPTSTTGARLASGVLPNGSLIQVKGTVTAATPEGFTLDDEGIRIDVPNQGRKEFGVEATKLDLSLPPVGTVVSVTGIVGIVPPADAKAAPVIQIHLRSGADLQNLPQKTSWLRYPWMFGLLLALLPTLIAMRSFRRRTN